MSIASIGVLDKDIFLLESTERLCHLVGSLSQMIYVYFLVGIKNSKRSMEDYQTSMQGARFSYLSFIPGKETTPQNR